MTQQEINDYFIASPDYLEIDENTFVDQTGPFTFVSGTEQLSMSYPGPPEEYGAVIRNSFLADAAALTSWITAVEQDALNPPGI